MVTAAEPERPKPAPEPVWVEPEAEPPRSASVKPNPPSSWKGPRPVILERGSVDAPLFEDEVGRLMKDVATLIEKNESYPVSVLNPERLAELKAIAASGKLRKDGPKCAAPPSEAEVVNAAYPGLLVAELSFSCTGKDCNAHYAVSAEPHRVHTKGGSGTPLLEGFARPKNPSNEADWRAAFAADSAAVTKGADRTGSFGGIGRGTVGSNGKMSVQWVDTFGFAQAVPREDFDREAEQADASCKKPAPFGSVLLAVGADGKVSRCESAAGSCYCTAFSKHGFGPGDPGRRVRIEFAHAGLGGGRSLGGSRSSPGLVRVSQGGRTYDEPFDASKPRTAALAKCFAVGRAAVSVDVRSTLNADGTVMESSVDKGADALTADEKDCVVRASKKFLYRCPDEVGDEVWGRFHVRG